MINAKLTDKQDLQITASPTDDTGASQPLQAATYEVVSDNPDVIGNGVVSQDGPANYIALCTVAGVGVANLTVNGDADLGDGVETISEVIQVTVEHTRAKQLGVTVTAIPKP